MATSNILDTFTNGSITITLASLATSTARAGRGSASVDNTTNRFTDLIVFLKIVLGASSTIGKSVQIYRLRDSNNTPVRTDAWAGTDANLTVLNAAQIGILESQTAAETLSGDVYIAHPGPKWGIAIVHDTAQNLSSTEANHVKEFVGINPQAQ